MAGLFLSRAWKLWKPTLGFGINPSHALSQGLIGAWVMNEGGGLSLKDLSGKNNTGALTGGPTWSAGQFGPALSFNGSSSYVDLGSGVPLATRISISARLKVASFIANMQIVCSDASVRRFQFRVNSSNGIDFVVFDGGGSVLAFASSATTLSANIFYHVIGTYDGSNAYVYINGVQDATGAGSGSSATVADTIYIGARNTGSLFFSGVIDEVLIYNRALSSYEVQQLYVDPFCFMQPARGQILSFPSTAPPPATGYLFIGNYF